MNQLVHNPPIADPNRRAGKCATCGVTVKRGEGIAVLEDGTWNTYHRDHYQAAPQEPPYVEIKLADDGHNIEVRLKGGRAPRELFNAYRAACGPCKAKKDRSGNWYNTLPLARAAEVLGAMQAIDGLGVQADESVTGSMRGQAERKAERFDEMQDRLRRTNARLAAEGKALYPYQRHGIEWLSQQVGGILADDMGLGKTVQALIAAPEGAPILVICPAVAKGVWVREAKRWRPDLKKPVMLSGRDSFRWPEPGEMVVTNYDILSDDIGQPSPDTIVIADEAHAVKNAKAKRTKRFRAIGEAAVARGGHVWLLTATPLLNKPPDLWALLEATGRVREAFPGRNGFGEFAEMMGGYQNRYGWQWDMSAESVDPEVARRIAPIMLRRMKTEVLTDLPDKTVDDLIVGKLTKTQMKQLDALERKWDSVLRTDVLPPFEALSAARAMLAKSKIPALEDMVAEYEEAGEPLVVFSAHREPVLTIGKRPGWAVITGDTSPQERTQIEDDFQAGRLKGVAATIQAGGVAITLTRAANAIFADLDWTPSLNQQAEDRIYRIGQDRGVNITRLVAPHALDQRINEILLGKQQVIGASVDAARLQGDERALDEVALREEISQDQIIADQLDASTRDLVAELAEYLAVQEEFEEEIRRLRGRARREAEHERERNWQREIKSIARRRKSVTIDIEDEDDETLRGPMTPVEEWAKSGLVALDEMNLDNAKYENSMGYNKADTLIGRQLAMRAESVGLSDAEWTLAISMLAKYHRQIGPMPAHDVVVRTRKEAIEMVEDPMLGVSMAQREEMAQEQERDFLRSQVAKREHESREPLRAPVAVVVEDDEPSDDEMEEMGQLDLFRNPASGERMMKVKLSDAQIAALEGRGLDDAMYPDERLLADAWESRTHLIFPLAEADAVSDALAEASNAEDGADEEMRHRGDKEGAKYAGRAARSLSNLSVRIRRDANKRLGRQNPSSLKLWKFDRGEWRAVRSVTEETAAQWLAIWQRDEPRAQFVVAARKPKRDKTLFERRAGPRRGAIGGREVFENPPYSGYDKQYYRRKAPDDQYKIAYRRKRDALNVFLEANRALVDDYGGENMKHSAASFDAINHRFDIEEPRRKVDTIAKAVWWALQKSDADGKYYIEDIDVNLLNDTAPAIFNPRGLQWRLPDHVEEEAFRQQEAEHWERYSEVEYPEDAPF